MLRSAGDHMACRQPLCRRVPPVALYESSVASHVRTDVLVLRIARSVELTETPRRDVWHRASGSGVPVLVGEVPRVLTVEGAIAAVPNSCLRERELGRYVDA